MSHNKVTNCVSKNYFPNIYLMAIVIRMSDEYFCEDERTCKHSEKT